jgi:hypothetical protein
MSPRKYVCPTIVALAASFTCLSAVADSGIYIGGGLGKSKIEDSTGNPGGVPFNESATGGKAFVGYHLDFLPILTFAAEAGYRDFGKPESTVGGVPVEYRARGFDYGLLGGVGLGPVDLLARVGGMSYRLHKTVGGTTNDYDGNAPVYGVGLWFMVAHIGVRAEYERIKIDELDKAEMVSVSAFYQF